MSEDKARAELTRLQTLWATGRASRKQIMRAMELRRTLERAQADDFAAKFAAKHKAEGRS